MVRYFTLIWCMVIANVTFAEEQTSTPISVMQAKVKLINQLQNDVLMKNSTQAQIDKLFSMYTPSFEYVHQVYGGTYSREHLYANTVKFHKAGNYDFTEARYKIVRMIPGYNAIAVERLQFDGKKHLAVFEFDGEQVARIIEYWK